MKTGAKLLGAVLVTCSLWSSAIAQQKTPPAPGAARPLNLPTMTERRLPNGLTVVLARLPNVPKISAILTFRGAGTGADRIKHPGIADITASVAIEGTNTRTSKQITEELRSIGGSLSLDTDTDATFVTATSLSEFSTRLFDLMSDVTRNANFPQNELELAQENTIQAIRSDRADPSFLVGERFNKAVFGDHPYSFVVADEKSIAALTRTDLKTFVNTYYIPNSSHLIVVGDIDVEKTFAEIQKSFGPWRAGAPLADQQWKLPTREKRQIYFVNRPGSVQSGIYVGNISIPRKDKDYFALRTADTIFGGSFYSRLTRNIREGKGYTYSPFSSAFTRAKSGHFVTGAFVRNEVTGPTLLEIFYELDRMRVSPVTDEELNAAKEFSTGNFSIELASQLGLAGRINTIYEYDLPKDFIADFRPKIEALTAVDIQKAASKYFDTYRAAIVIVGDYDKVKDQITPFGDVTVYDAEGNVISK